MTTVHSRKSIGRSLLLLLALLGFPGLVGAFPNLQIPSTDVIFPGTIYYTDGLGHPLIPPVYRVTAVTLQAWGGTPFSGYTWTLSPGSTFPAGTTVDPLTGIFHGTGNPLVAGGPYFFDMTVSDGSTTAHGTYSFTVNNDFFSPPAAALFEQSNQCCWSLPNAQAGQGYGASLYADGGTPPYQNWSLAGGALPPGMVIDQARGIVRGTPASSADGHTYSFQVNVFDSTGTMAHNFYNLTYTFTVGSHVVTHPAFFNGETALGGGWFYLQFPNGTPFGYYSYLSDQHFIYHIDLGFEYLFDANDANHGIFFYDFASSSFFYTNSTIFPYLYDFSLNALLYYLPDANNPGRYSHNPRWFYNFATGQWITL